MRVCHSDLHVASGDWPQIVPITKKPLILGHEIAGRVVEKGAAVNQLELGDRVGVPWVHWTCGECEFCREGNENRGAETTNHRRNCGRWIRRICQGSRESRPEDSRRTFLHRRRATFCAGVTAYRALKQAGIQPGQRLAVFGVGGLGHLAVQIGQVLGAIVSSAIDVSDEKLEQAKGLGASVTLNAANVNAVKELRRAGWRPCRAW